MGCHKNMFNNGTFDTCSPSWHNINNIFLYKFYFHHQHSNESEWLHKIANWLTFIINDLDNRWSTLLGGSVNDKKISVIETNKVWPVVPFSDQVFRSVTKCSVQWSSYIKWVFYVQIYKKIFKRNRNGYPHRNWGNYLSCLGQF